MKEVFILSAAIEMLGVSVRAEVTVTTVVPERTRGRKLSALVPLTLKIERSRVEFSWMVGGTNIIT